ncbi:MAG: winged helix-turn-helix domain-containing protein, partial [Acidobacteria bacterium]|nr:winged helix-turn-helix domain-containing protein [Acidobacteriota bacterium]
MSWSAEPAVKPPIRFASFEIDPNALELRSNGELVKLTGQPLRILILLAERAGELITREDIARVIWGEKTFVEFDQNLNFSIKQIRAALGDNARTPIFIQTLPRRGYRFLGRLEPAGSVPPSAPVEMAPEPSEQPVHKSGRRRLWAAALSSLALLAITGFLAVRWRSRAPSFGKTMVLVLPCEDLSGQPGQEYLAGGLTEELMTRLGQFDPARLGVIAASTANGGGRPSKVDLGRQFGAAYVLRESLRI